MKKEKYVIILNFESESIDVLDLVNCPENMDIAEFIEDNENGLDYSFSLTISVIGRVCIPASEL